MLTLHITLKDYQVSVRANGKESHQSSLVDLSQSKQEWKDFLDNPRVYGKKLFNTLFKNLALVEFDALTKQTDRTIVLVLGSPELDSIAWEYAYHDNAYIVEDFAFIRALPEKERPHSNGRMTKSVERLPLLFIPANPLVDLNGEPMRELDIESEWREMTQHIVRSNAPFDLIELRPATPEALQSVMARFQNGMIAHFSGHGAATKDGAFLLFENENGSSNPIEAREFVREVKDQAWIGFLSACQSAVAERTEYSNLARELVKAGVPFALGMQFNLPDPFAPNISGQFYNYLSQGHAVPEATRQARRAVKRENEFYVGMIALYAAHPDEAGKMGWTGSGARTLSTFAAADVSDVPTPSGFIGRQRELMNIGTSLLGKKKPNTVTLHGAGGIGKTALMRQTLLRFSPSFEAALAIALDPLPSLESVLVRLERFLNLPSPCSNDTKERERIVREKLTGRETLLGLDNFETLNYALNEKGSDKEKTSKRLHSFFKYLAANGVTLCVTSREVTNLGGELIIDIEGLPNDVGGRLFQDNVVRQKGEIYIEKIQQVSEMVGGHPLALRLLASAFDDQVGTSLDQYIEDLQSFLPKAHDKWTEEDRHESLRASFDFTMNNLAKTEEGKNLQIALSRLSVFIAYFADFIAAPVLKKFFPKKGENVINMGTKVHSTLHTLWERGMLERTYVLFEDETFFLYRLHPTLGFFARERLTDAKSVKEYYWKSLSTFARVAEDNIHKIPFIVQIALHTLPDLIAAAESKSDEDAGLMQFSVSIVLQELGLYDDSLRLLEKSLEIDETLNRQRGKAAVLGEMAKIHVVRGNLNKGLELQNEKLAIAKEIGDKGEESSALHEIAGISYIRGDLDNAMKLYQQSLDLKGSSSDNLRSESATLNNMAQIYFTRGDLDTAMKLFQQALDIFENLGDLYGKSATLAWIAVIEKLRGNLGKALSLYQETFEIGKALRNPEIQHSALHQIAEIYVTRGDFDEAMILYHQSLIILEGLGNIKGKSTVLHSVARIYVIRGDLDEAMKLYMQSLEIKDGLGDLQGKAVTIGEMAKIYVRRGDLNKGLEMQEEKLRIVRGIGDKREESVALHNMAEIFIKRGTFDEAMKLYQEALIIEESLGELEGKSTTLAGMGIVLLQQKKVPDALRKFAKALSIQEEIGVKSEVQSFQEFLPQFRRLLGAEKFDALWQEETGKPIPEWLTQQPQQEEGITAEQFIAGAIQSAREKRPEAEQYFKEAQRLAIDSDAPAELQELGKVLQRIMVGEKNVDLSVLTDELREIVEKALVG